MKTSTKCSSFDDIAHCLVMKCTKKDVSFVSVTCLVTHVAFEVTSAVTSFTESPQPRPSAFLGSCSRPDFLLLVLGQIITVISLN